MCSETIAGYRVLSKLAEGELGPLYRAHDKRRNRDVAIQVLASQVAAGAQTRKAFENELRGAVVLRNPNIANIYGLEDWEGKLVVAMEYVAGRTLSEVLYADPQPLALSEVLRYATQIAEALETAHERGIVHRRIRPSNIMITDGGQAKVLGFGLGSSMRTAATLPSAAYLSPQQIEGNGVEREDDVWSFGVVLYEMLAGERPFAGEDEKAITYAIVHEAPQPIQTGRRDVPPVLASIVEKALAKDPKARYHQIGDMLADLLAVRKELGNEAVTAQTLLLPHSKRAGRLIALAIVLLFLVIVGYWIKNKVGL